MKLIVTQEDIDTALAKKADSDHWGPSMNCPISAAASRLFDTKCGSAFGAIFVFSAEFKLRTSYFNEDISQFQSAFDKGEDVAPGEFELVQLS